MRDGLHMGVKSRSNSRSVDKPAQSPRPERIATSTSPAAKSTMRLSALNRISSQGSSAWNEPRCLASQPLANVLVVDIRSTAPVLLLAAAKNAVLEEVLVVGWLPLLAGFAMLMLAADDGAQRVVVFVLLTVCSDVGGYVAGVLFGRHPLAPTVSPKKSWEGLGGSVVLCLVAGVASVTLMLGGTWWAGALVGLAAVFAATLGDLSESILKRDLGIKDMGTLVPGHGGVLDRLDSLLAVAPTTWLLLHLLVR